MEAAPASALVVVQANLRLESWSSRSIRQRRLAWLTSSASGQGGKPVFLRLCICLGPFGEWLDQLASVADGADFYAGIHHAMTVGPAAHRSGSDYPSAVAKTDHRKARPAGMGTQDDLVAILEKPARLAGGQRDRIAPAIGGL
jgi:hypothetical protein